MNDWVLEGVKETYRATGVEFDQYYFESETYQSGRGEIERGIEAGLFYRSYLANAANAHAMVAIHNNAGWEVRLESPGSDVYYQSQVPDSRRFARIMVEELQRSFAPFEADWVGALETGAKSRLSPREGNPQYYGILRRSEMPTVIAEGVYIANQSEADLLETAEFRQAYADAVYRALVRFLTTDDVGGGSDTDPVIWYGDAGSGDAISGSCEADEEQIRFYHSLGSRLSGSSPKQSNGPHRPFCRYRNLFYQRCLRHKQVMAERN